jgi:8-oxo-dGTP pyrophosphatase MutT (NUDIX family)
MSDWIDSEGYRANVGIVLMRDNGEVFLGQRTGGRGWQFPQGGVRQGDERNEQLCRRIVREWTRRRIGGRRQPFRPERRVRLSVCAERQPAGVAESSHADRRRAAVLIE